jgi:drug/metabolite transporter (DMT)-like permease
MNIYSAIGFALIAAIGNALFVAAQKKAAVIDSSFGFILLSLCITMMLLAATTLVTGLPDYKNIIRQGGGWIALSGFGLFLVYVGFFLLYSRFGASHYILYAVLSILTTTLLVGLWFYKEMFNGYHWAAMLCALLTVLLFSLADAKS